MPFVSQLDQYALTTLVKANYYLGLTSDVGEQDNAVEQMINRASVLIENYCLRKFKARLYVKERYDGRGGKLLYFNQYPVLAVNLDNLSWDSAAKTVTRDDGGSFVTDGFRAGDKVLVQNSDENSGLLTIATDGVAALILTFIDNIVTDIEDDNVVISHFRELWIDDSKIDEDDYKVFSDYIYYGSSFDKDYGNVRITYYAGYTAIPYDLEQACLKLVKLFYEKNEDVKSEKLGPYSVAFFDTEDLPVDIKNTLNRYKSWVMV